MPKISYIVLPCVFLLLSACSSDKTDDIESTELTYYESAQSSLRSGNYAIAVSKLQLLEGRFPFGRYAEQAQLEIIYAYYRSCRPFYSLAPSPSQC